MTLSNGTPLDIYELCSEWQPLLDFNPDVPLKAREIEIFKEIRRKKGIGAFVNRLDSFDYETGSAWAYAWKINNGFIRFEQIKDLALLPALLDYCDAELAVRAHAGDRSERRAAGPGLAPALSQAPEGVAAALPTRQPGEEDRGSRCGAIRRPIARPIQRK